MDDLSLAAVFEVMKRHNVDARPALVGERDATSELDDTIVTDVDAMVVVATEASHLEMRTWAERAAHGTDGTCVYLSRLLEVGR